MPIDIDILRRKFVDADIFFLDTKANKNLLQVLGEYFMPDESPMLYFAVMQDGTTPRMLLTNKRIFLHPDIRENGRNIHAELKVIAFKDISGIKKRRGKLFSGFDVTLTDKTFHFDVSDEAVLSQFLSCYKKLQKRRGQNEIQDITGLSADQADKIRFFFDMRCAGKITEEEYRWQKTKILQGEIPEKEYAEQKAALLQS